MQLKAIIVDDEPLARDFLRSLLAKYDDLEVVGECANGDDAVDAPIVPERLERALRRVREKLGAQTAQLTQEQLRALLNSVRSQTELPKAYAVRFLVRDRDKEILLPVSEIDWIEADAYYSRLHVNDKHYMLRESITELNNKLDPASFVRVHRSSIVNVERIREVHREGRTDSSLVLKSGSVLRMSRQGRQRLIDLGR